MDLDPGGMQKVLQLIRWQGLITALVIASVAWVLLRSIATTVGRLSTRFSERRLFFQQVEAFLRFVIYFVAFFGIVLAILRLDESLLTVLGGTLIFTVGFALKDLAASVLAGIIILIDKPFQVGDRVTFSGTYGQVTSIGLRCVRILTLDHNLVTIPNSRLLTELAATSNDGALEMQIPIEFYIGADQDVERAQNLVEEAVLSSRYVFLGRPAPVHVAQVIHQNHFAVRLRVRPYVLDVQYEEDFATDVTKRVLRAFQEHHIGPPAVLHRGSGSAGPPS